MWHGGWAYLRAGDQKPTVTRQLLLRVLNYARPYTLQIVGILHSAMIRFFFLWQCESFEQPCGVTLNGGNSVMFVPVQTSSQTDPPGGCPLIVAAAHHAL